MGIKNPHLLFISSSSPLSPFSGYAYRAHGMLQWLIKHFSIDLVFEGDVKEIEKSFIPIKHFNHIEVVPPFRSLSHVIKAIVGNLPYHHTLFSHPFMSSAVRKLLNKKQYGLIWLNKSVHYPIIPINNQVPIIIDQHAAEPIVWDNLIVNDPRWYAKPFFIWNKSKVLRYDRMVYDRVAGIICISELDATTTKKFYPESNTIVIPQGVDQNYYKPSINAAPDVNQILFSGTGALRNVQAARFFVDDIMPLLQKHNSEFHFLWIGNVKREKHAFLNKDWIKTTGFVEHTPPYFDLGKIYVAPFNMGEGMKTKIIEAMSMGTVVVSTPVGVQGIKVDGLPFIKVCSDPVNFAKAVLEFRESPDLHRLGALAREYTLKNYAWDAVLKPLGPFIERCIHCGDSAR
jgi:glycosyltransferase involved in cell wall biosynthesis